MILSCVACALLGLLVRNAPTFIAGLLALILGLGWLEEKRRYLTFCVAYGGSTSYKGEETV